MTRRGRDPFSMAAKFDSTCHCGAAIKKGDRIFYYPISRTAKGSRCGCSQAAQADFNAHADDERMYHP